MTRVCSIDVGKVNLGVYIEEFTDYPTGNGLYLRRVDLTEHKNERVSTVLLQRLFTYLDTITIDCDYYVIEKQLRANPEAQFVDHAIQSYFLIKGKNVISFSSKNKTKLFDGTKMTKYQRKKWAIIKAQQLLFSRGQSELIRYVESLKKKDDVSDAICQLDAWKTLYFLKKKEITQEKVDQIHLDRSKIEIPVAKRGKKSTDSVAEKKSRKKAVKPPVDESPSAAVVVEKKSRKKAVKPPVDESSVAVVVEKKSRKKAVKSSVDESSVVENQDEKVM